MKCKECGSDRLALKSCDMKYAEVGGQIVPVIGRWWCPSCLIPIGFEPRMQRSWGGNLTALFDKPEFSG